ncbi:MAG: hypothetical protein PF637_10785 [Spirochaetes bacterium]|nr:hypothetical protein [Spirochaetota bacterium]
MKKVVCVFSLFVSVLVIDLPISAKSYYNLRGGVGIAGGSDSMMGRSYEAIRSDGGEGPGVAAFLSSSYMRTLTARHSIAFSGVLCGSYSPVAVDSSASPVPIEDTYDVLWSQHELDAKYIYSISPSLSVFVGPRLISVYSSADYPYTDDHEGYADSFSYLEYTGGLTGGISWRKHLFSTLFLLTSISYGGFAGTSVFEYSNTKENESLVYVLNGVSVGCGYYLSESETLLELGALSNFYIRDAPIMISFDDNIHMGRIFMYAGITRPFKK